MKPLEWHGIYYVPLTEVPWAVWKWILIVFGAVAVIMWIGDKFVQAVVEDDEARGG